MSFRITAKQQPARLPRTGTPNDSGPRRPATHHRRRATANLLDWHHNEAGTPDFRGKDRDEHEHTPVTATWSRGNRIGLGMTIAMGVANIVFELRRRFPDARILLLGIFPRSGPDSEVRAKIREINQIIAALHDGQHTFFMDIGPRFLNEDGSIPRDVMHDGLHPTSKGYEIWAEAVKEPLARLMGKDSLAGE